MLTRLKVEGVPLPPVYIAECKADADIALESGLPYIRKPKDVDDELLVKAVLFDILQRKFPKINWYKVLGIEAGSLRREIVVEVPGNASPAKGRAGGRGEKGDALVDVAQDTRMFDVEGTDPEQEVECMAIADYLNCEELAAKVNVEALQALDLLPSFVSDIATAVKRNLFGRDWSEGYNKKLGVPLGNFNMAHEKPNLMIIDVSGSIPRGVSSTMLVLADSLRHRCNADLIITGSTSMFWKNGDELPSPDWIREHIGLGNESSKFYEIIMEEVEGRDFGNLIVFGDWDTPSLPVDLGMRTRFEKVWCYHTTTLNVTPGYATWYTSKHADDDMNIEYDTSWVDWMV